jgi:plasmid stability protein
MATLTIRDVDDALMQRLRIRAAQGNRSLEEEVRQILRAALMSQPQPEAGLAQRVRARFAGLGDVQLPLAEREPIRMTPVPGAEPAAVPRRKPKAGSK